MLKEEERRDEGTGDFRHTDTSSLPKVVWMTFCILAMMPLISFSATDTMEMTSMVGWTQAVWRLRADAAMASSDADAEGAEATAA